MARKWTDKAAFDGETLTGAFRAPDGTTAVAVRISDGSTEKEIAAVANGDGTYTATATAADIGGMSGATRWIASATTPDSVEVIASGEIYIRPLVSKYRAVVRAVEEALQNYGNNPNKSISVGELSITYKDRSDLLDMLSYWRSRAEADEAGARPSGGVKFVKVRFA